VSALLEAGRVGGVSFSALGEGSPVTVFAHGLGGSSAETRPLARTVGGTRVLLDLRGHGESDALPGGWDYDLLADDLLGVADAVGADRAVGLSLGGGALLRALSRDPARFTRIAFVMPAALDGLRTDGATQRVRLLGDAIDAGDVDRVTAILLSEVPAEARERRGVATLVARRAQQLTARPAPRPLHEDRPLTDRALLAAVRVPALVIAQEGDPLHPVVVAQELCEALPSCELLVLPPGGVFWSASREAREALAGHLA